MPQSPRRLALAIAALCLLLIAILAATVAPFSARLREGTRQALVERHAAVLHPVALQQLAEREAYPSAVPARPRELMTAALQSSRQQGMLAVVIFDTTGDMLAAVPPSLLLPELATDDYLRLLGGTRLSRFHERFPLDRYFRGVSAAEREAPVLEVLLPLHGADPTETLGFAQYLIDARALAHELAALDAQIRRQTLVTLALGAASIALLGTGAYFGLRRAHRQIAERSERLARANFELTLAAKASALGQITSHLIHGLQGPVAGLRASLATGTADLQSAAEYSERLEALVRETVALLSDMRAEATYELTGGELVTALRQRAATSAEGPALTFTADDAVRVDNHRGSVLCLIAVNLVQNAAAATGPAGHVAVDVAAGAAPGALTLTVRDDGPGIPEAVRRRLFEPGASGRAGGTGLGLALSRLLARQIDATLALDRTGPDGTVFAVTLPGANRTNSER